MKQSMFRQDLFRLIHSYGFWFSIVGSVAVVLCSNLLGVLEDPEFLAVDTIMDDFLYGGWYRNLLFVVAACPFAGSYCQDTAHGFRDIMIQKMGIFPYTQSKVWCTAFSSFIVSFAGLLISAGFLRIICTPCYYETFGEMNYTYPYGMLAAGGNTLLFLVMRSALFSLGAAFWSVFALVVSTWREEPLIVLSAPFIGSYIESRFQFFMPSWMQVNACVSGDELIASGIASNFFYGICYLVLLNLLLGMLFFNRVKRSVYGENMS